MSRLGDLSVGGFTGARRAPTARARIVTTDVETYLQVSPELAAVKAIPGVEPYFTPELIPDLIYILQREGLEAVLNELYPTTIPDGVTLQVTPPSPGVRTIKEEILFEFSITSLEQVLAAHPQLPFASIVERGVAALIALISISSPQEPNSIILNHRSQDVHRATEKVHIELIKNEPDVVERSTITCSCGSGKVNTTMKQTRRADEAQTIFAQCVSCKANWTM